MMGKYKNKNYAFRPTPSDCASVLTDNIDILDTIMALEDQGKRREYSTSELIFLKYIMEVKDAELSDDFIDILNEYRFNSDRENDVGYENFWFLKEIIDRLILKKGDRLLTSDKLNILNTTMAVWNHTRREQVLSREAIEKPIKNKNNDMSLISVI